MALFEKNWIANRWVDFEYKKYILLSYLQQIEAKYQESKVYPYLTILRDELKDLQLLQRSLQKSDFDELKLKLFGEQPAEEQRPEEIDNLLQIAAFAVPKISGRLEEGRELEQFVKDSIDFQPVGVIPVQKREGYLIFRQGQWSRTYRYELRRITPGNDNEIHSTHLKTWYVQHCSSSRYRTLNDIKYELIKSQKDLPNPATYAIECHLAFPYPETLVPIGRKLLYKSITEE